jgi:hypothetical protein
MLLERGGSVDVVQSSRRPEAATFRWRRVVVRCGLVYGLGGPPIGFVALLLWGAMSGRMFEGRSAEGFPQVLGGLMLLLPAAYLLAFVPATLTGLLLSPVLAAGRRRLFLVTSPMVAPWPAASFSQSWRASRGDGFTPSCKTHLGRWAAAGSQGSSARSSRRGGSAADERRRRTRLEGDRDPTWGAGWVWPPTREPPRGLR